ncbi:hypothetical protein [Gymnodinialimonas sp.]
MKPEISVVSNRERALVLYQISDWMRSHSLAADGRLCCSTFLEFVMPEKLKRFTFHVSDVVRRKGSREILRGLTEFTPDPKVTISTKVYLDALDGEPSCIGTVYHECLHAIEHHLPAAQGRLSKAETKVLEAEADFVAAAVMFPLSAITNRTTALSLRADHYDDPYLAEVALRHANAVYPNTWRR